MELGPELKKRRKELGLTLESIAKIVGVEKSTVRKWETGDIASMKRDKIVLLAKALKVSPLWVLGIKDPADVENITSVKTKKVPLLGTIAAGEPLLVAESPCEYYIEVDRDLHIDFCLKIKGDSMVDARIYDGDLVFIRQQPVVENGEIAAVLIDNEATLKRVYLNNDGVILKPENGKYQPKFYTEQDFKDIKILGKAVFLQGNIY